MLKNFSSYFLFSILNAGITFTISVFLARSLSLESFGKIGLFLAILYFARPLANFNTIGLVSINKVQLNSREFQVFSNKYFTFQLLFFVFILTIFILISQVFYEYKFILQFLPFLVFIMIFTDFHNAELVQEKKSISYGLYIFFTRMMILFFSILFIKLFNLDWYSYLLSLFLSEILILFIRLKNNFITLKEFKFLLDKHEIKNIVKYGLPLFIALLSGWGLNQSDKFIVAHYFSLKEVAFYTVAYSFGVVINTINQALTNTMVPTIYKALKNGNAQKIITKYTFYYSLIIAIIILFIAILSPYFIPFFYGEEYLKSVLIVVLIAIALGFSGIYRITGMVIEYYKLNVLKTKIVFTSMVINLIISIIFIGSYGILAPAIGTIFAYMFLATTSQYYGYKIMKDRNEKIN